MQVYRHSQFGTLTVILVGAAFLAATVGFALVPQARVAMGPVLALMFIVGMLFYRLTVVVTKTDIKAIFGNGVIRRTIPLNRVKSVRAVRNKFWYGWGIRWIPHGWMFNISGFDAVELEFTNGRKFRIGTDEPDRLVAAIEQARPGKSKG